MAASSLTIDKIVIDDEFKNFLPAVEDATFLRGKIDVEGWSTEPITVWMPHGILLDGHRRYDIWKERGDAGPPVRELTFSSREAAFYWVVNNQRARRNLTPEQERYLLGRKYTAEKKAKGGYENVEAGKKSKAQNGLSIPSGPGITARRLAKEEGVGHNTVKRSEHYADAVDDLDARGVVSKSAILSGSVKLPASKVIAAANAATDQEAKEVIETATKGGKPQRQETKRVDQSKAVAGDDPPAADRQREIAVAAIHDVIDFLKRSPLMRLGVSNPHRDYAYKRVIGWLRSNMKDKKDV